MNESTIFEIIHQKEWTFWTINKYYYKKVTKIGGISFIENVIKIGENSFTKTIENVSASINISLKNSPKLVTF